MTRVAPLLLALAGAVLWAMLSIMPPAARGADAPATAFSAERAFTDIAAIARAPHPVGSAEAGRVRAHLAARLRALGADVSEQPVPLPAKSLARLGRWSGRKEAGVIAHNVIGVLPGSDRSMPALLLMAHHDSVWGSPGAADDAIGIAVALETARALRSRGRLQRDLILLFTDSEEINLDGSRAFFGQHPIARRVGMILNMEARGGGGRANMFETGPGNGAQMRVYADMVDRPAAHSLSVLIYDLMPNYTDYSIARRYGIAGYNFALLDRGDAYHSPAGTIETVDPRSVQDMGDQILALASALGLAGHLPPKTPNAAFSDLLGRTTIAYPTAAGWAILSIAAALMGAALWRTPPSARAVGGGVIQTTALLLHGALLLTALNAVSGSGGANYYDRLAALPRLELVAGLAIAALLMLVGRFRRPGAHARAVVPAMTLMWVGLLTGGPLILLVALALLAMLAAWFLPASARDSGSSGALLLLLAASVAVQAALPTAGPLLQWPLLLSAIAVGARSFLPDRIGMAITLLCAAAGVGHLLSQAHFIFLGIGAEVPAVMIVVLFAALPLLLPLWPGRIAGWFPGSALAVALMLACWIRFDPIAPSVPTYSRAEGRTKN